MSGGADGCATRDAGGVDTSDHRRRDRRPAAPGAVAAEAARAAARRARGARRALILVTSLQVRGVERPDAGREPPHDVVPRRRQHAPELQRPHEHGPALRRDRQPALPRRTTTRSSRSAAAPRRARATTTAPSGTACSPSGKGFVRYGPPRVAHRADARGALRARRVPRAARRRSTRPTASPQVERDVMERVAGASAAGVDARYPADVQPDYAAPRRRRLPALQGRIMRADPRVHASSSTSARCARSQQARSHVRALSVVQIGDPRRDRARRRRARS